MKSDIHRAGGRVIFHPALILGCAALTAVLFGLVAGQAPNFIGAGRFILWSYHVPIVFAFVVYGFDQAGQPGRLRPAQGIVSLAAITLALARAVREIPFYSGHGLFIAYMLGTCSSRLARITALVVLADVLWAKVGLWQDPTVLGGLAAGALFALAYRRLGRNPDPGLDARS